MALPVQVPQPIIEGSAILLAGNLANWGLYGVLFLQTYLYAVSFPNDRFFLKTVVYLALLLETAHCILVTFDLWNIIEAGLANPLSGLLIPVGTEWFSVPVINGMIASLTQFFYCYRIGNLTRSRYTVIIILMLSLMGLGGAIGLAIETKRAVFIDRVYWFRASFILTGIWAAANVACDLLIAVLMVYHLKRRDTDIGNHTHRLVSRIIMVTVETGSTIAFLNVVAIILALFPGHPPWYQALALPLGKVYSNSMMVALNSRIKVVANSGSGRWNESATSDVHFSSSKSGKLVFLKTIISDIGFGLRSRSVSDSQVTQSEILSVVS